MPKASRPQRTKLLLRSFTQYYRLSQELRKRREAIVQQLEVPETRTPPPPTWLEPLEPIVNLSVTSGLPELTCLSSGLDDYSSNPSSLSSDSSSDTGSWLSTSDSDAESMDTPLPNFLDGLTADTCSHGSHDDSDIDVGWDGDDESDGLLGTGNPNSSRNVRSFVIDEIKNMYAHRYEMPHHRLPRGPRYLHHVLTVLKYNRPDHFRQALRVSPTTFDTILHRISGDPVFTNNSN
jgi:hypothetical protein